MNGPMSSAAGEPVWERPWSLEEIRKSSQNWSLGADAGLLNFLREFSHQTISRTHDIEKQLDGLVREAKSTECRLHNVFNDFLMLSNTQFIENRVYDEEVEEHIVKSDPAEKPEQEKTREQKEAELIPKIQEAVNYGLQVLETAFEQLDIKAGNSDSEEDEVNERVELILEPKDLYIDRPLPYLIGSQLFMQQEDVGLGDLSSEEGSVDNDRGSVIDSEEEDEKDDEDSEEDFGNNSEEDNKLRTALSDEDEDNGSDLFGDSDKEEEEEEEETVKATKTRTKSFVDELAARIQVEVPKRQETDQSSISSMEVKSKKEKREVRKAPSDDEDDDIFKPPQLTDEDFFGNKGGLFSGGKGLFDDDDEEEGDLFSDVSVKERKPVEPAPVRKPVSEPASTDGKKKPPYGGVSLFLGAEDVINSSVLADKEKRKLPTPSDAAQKTTNGSLFDDEDEIFGGSSKAQPSGKVKEASDLFADDDDLFNDRNSGINKKSKEPEPVKPESVDKKNVQVPPEKSKLPELSNKKHIGGLFSDEDDSESDLFSPSQSASKSKAATLPATKTSKPLSLFDDEDEDLFGSITERKTINTASKSVQQPIIPTTAKTQQKSGLFSSDEEDLATASNNVKPVEKSRKDSVVPPKTKKEERTDAATSLFGGDDVDVFAITKDSQKKHHRVSLLFEEDESSEEPLFASGVTPAVSVAQPPEQPNKFIPAKVSLFDDADKKPEAKTPVQVLEDKEPSVMKKENMVKPVSDQEPFADNLFAASPIITKQNKIKGKNVLSLFGDDENDIEDQFPRNITPSDSGKDSLDKVTHGKSTGVFQDEELLFSQELQKDNDPDVDLFASTSKKSSEKPSNAHLSGGVGLFGDDEEDDLFSTSKPKKPPKVQERKPVLKKESFEPSKESDILPVLNKKPTESSPVKTKSPSSRIGKLQANLLINPAALLPGAVPKLSGVRSTIPETDVPASMVAENAQRSSSDTGSKSVEGVSFDTTAEVDTLYSANKSRVKVGGKRRPPTRMGRKLASQEFGETEDLFESTPVLAASDINAKSHRNESASTMKLSFSENDVQSKATKKVPVNPLTPDVNDLFGSDLFENTPLPKPVVSKQKEISPGIEAAQKSTLDQGKKSSVVVKEGDGNDDDPFTGVKNSSKKAFQPSSLIDSEPEDDLLVVQKPQKKVAAPAKVIKPVTSDIFEDDIFATEAVKPIKKPKEKKPAAEVNLFDDNMDIFADLTHKPKEKKSKKKVEPKSIFDDDMDDIFSTSSSNVKNEKQKTKSNQPASETKPCPKAATAFDDPLNVLGN